MDISGDGNNPRTGSSYAHFCCSTSRFLLTRSFGVIAMAMLALARAVDRFAKATGCGDVRKDPWGETRGTCGKIP